MKVYAHFIKHLNTWSIHTFPINSTAIEIEVEPTEADVTGEIGKPEVGQVVFVNDLGNAVVVA